MKEFSTRQLKVGQEIKTILSEIFMRQDIYDPVSFKAINITISEVQVTPDLHNAFVYFIPLGGKDKEKMADILQPMAKRIKFQMGKQLKIRNIPDLIFKLDKSFDVAQKMEDLIKQ